MADRKMSKKLFKKNTMSTKNKGLKPVQDPFRVLKFVLMTEKCVRLIEGENKLTFIVDTDASKGDVRRAFKNIFKSDVSKVTTLLDQKGRKKAYIKLKKPAEAGEIAVRLGII